MQRLRKAGASDLAVRPARYPLLVAALARRAGPAPAEATGRFGYFASAFAAVVAELPETLREPAAVLFHAGRGGALPVLNDRRRAADRAFTGNGYSRSPDTIQRYLEHDALDPHLLTILSDSGTDVSEVPPEPVDADGWTEDDGSGSLADGVRHAAATWRGDLLGHRPASTLTGPHASAPVWNWENPPDDLDVSSIGQRPVNAEDVERLVRARGLYQEMYRRVGGVPTRPRIVALLNAQVAPLLRSAYDDPLGRRLFRAAAGLAAFAGVCAYDGDLQPLAQRHLLAALRLAKASGDRGLGGYVVALLANQALYLGDCRLVVQYASSALRAAGSGLAPAMITDLHALAGKAYARMGDGRPAREHLALSEAAANRLDFATGPAEYSYVAPGLVATQAAEAHRRLGDLRTAQEYAEESVRTAPLTHLRGQVHRHGGLALVLAARGEAEHAAQVGGLMLDRADGMESGRIADRIATVATALRRYRTEPGVEDFLQRARGYTKSDLWA
ncbi:transcriptional regulator [Longispora fulva]|uniref:Tetratricopeptide (TPR) repeat protein n=1 Tax=Longispora fulva TaxID=619741 RepID=A0A8J7GGV7_9ACTN|nr:hypothetical protein [Longispora fulva]MBG6140463.1 tetratricopeptide (TPR) repeat protein [Longispora fulva]GIG57155.1 transcriptional regulator [Longispora fulva]